MSARSIRLHLVCFPAAFVVAGLLAVPAAAQGAPVAAPTPVCPLMSKEEVKKLFPWSAGLDGMPVTEEAIGANGSSCSYPSLTVQLYPYSAHTVETLRKSGGTESVAGVGDAAYLRNNRGEYAEIYVKVGDRMLTLQAGIEGDYAAAKPRLAELAKAYVAKLR